MTGYGRASAVIDGRTLTVQVSSVNRRALDLTVSLPDAWESLEPAVTELVRRFAVRGKVHVEVVLQEAAGADDFAWDDAAVRAMLDRLAALAAAQGIAFRPTSELLWQIVSQRRKADEGFPSVDVAQAPLVEAAGEALHGFAVMRAKEGETLLIDFLARVAALRRLVEATAARAPLVANPAWSSIWATSASSRKSRCSPIVAMSPRRSRACAVTWNSSPRS